MSQYPPYPPGPPSPYSPPPQQPGYYGYYPPGIDPLAAAKRASLLMIILGALMLLMGAFVATVFAKFPIEQLPPEQARAFHAALEQAHMDQATLFVGAGMALAGMGLVLVVLGVLVRRGGKVAIVASIVLVSLIVLYLVMNGLALLGAPNGQAAVCMMVVPLALFVLSLVWLIQAARNVGQVRLTQQQYNASYWQYAQYQQQAYDPSGYNPSPPAPPPGPPAPPPPPP